ncbi:Zinc finger MYM-type protein 1-like [Oopsacas minuta]|uniref:Zinc finger MYM-type protein 1-like n=1 Tax=Oopsacas minuta TaxID=111878 RepID=A0AAV7JIF4_9METZ|nr:Zinc finger MYM-type protein 1-like [Oopsacas minuta]
MSLIDATFETLQAYISEKQWKEIWNEGLTIADDHDIEISSLPRKREHKLPAKLCDALLTTTVGHREELSTEDQYCVSIHYRVLDCMIDELNKRFNNESKLCMKGISACSPKSKNFFDFATIKPMLVNYKILEEDVQIELMQVKKVLRNQHTEDVHYIIDKLKSLKAAFPELLWLLDIALTIAVSSTACERPFSSLKPTKTYLRSTLSQLSLNNLAILSIESDISSSLRLKVVVDRFAFQHKNGRICLL